MDDQTPPAVPPAVYHHDSGTIDINQQAGETIAEAMGRAEAINGGPIVWAPVGDAPPPPAPVPPPPRAAAGPQLVHSGTYALWLTPAGFYHLTYRRTAGTHPDSGQVTAIDGAPDVHLRDLPPHAADMVIAVLDRDTELPPMLQQFFFGGNPLAGGKMAAMRQVAGLLKEGGLDQLMQLAGPLAGQQNGGPE